MIPIHFPPFDFSIKAQQGQQFIFDFVRKRYVRLTPEEWVRQHLCRYFVEVMHYPKGCLSLEKEIRVGQLKKRYDIVLYDPFLKPWMLVECKGPKVPVSSGVLDQLMRYHQVIQCPYWLLSNGSRHLCAEVSAAEVQWLTGLPLYAF